MNTKQKRTLATSLTSVVFTIVGATGVLMYFHWFTSYVKSLHEILGLAFVAVVVFHVFFNWASMRNYFTNKVFLASVIVVSLFAVSFIAKNASDSKGGDPRKAVIMAVLKAPLSDSFKILGTDQASALASLKQKGFDVEDAESLHEIATFSSRSPMEILGILSSKK